MADARIPLCNRKGEIVAWAIVDEGDYAWLSDYKWRHLSNGYAVRYTRDNKTVLMHRQIMGLKHGDRRQVDHINRDRLDCRRSNLRLAPRGGLDNQQNLSIGSRNTSGYRGVKWDKRRGKWYAAAQIARVSHFIGYFATAEEAGAAVAAFRRDHMPFSEEALANSGRTVAPPVRPSEKPKPLTRTCSTCGTVRPYEVRRCLPCAREWSRRWREANRERHNRNSRESYHRRRAHIEAQQGAA